MKKLSKKTYILITISIITVIYFIGMYNYRKPIDIHKTFNDAIITKKGSREVLKKTTIKIDAKLYRGLYRGSIISFNTHFINKLEGKMIIDNKEYYFDGFTEKSKLINILGSVYENNQSRSDDFWIRMNDLESITLIGIREKGHDYDIIVQPKK